MRMYERVSGVWKGVNNAYVNVSGDEKLILGGWERVGGVWKRFHSAGIINLDGHSLYSAEVSGAVVVGIRFNADGTVDRRSGASYSQIDNTTDWIVPNVGATLKTRHIRITHQSGAVFTGDAIGSWITLGNGQSREWSHTRSPALGVGSSTGEYLIEISDDGGSTAAASALYPFEAEKII